MITSREALGNNQSITSRADPGISVRGPTPLPSTSLPSPPLPFPLDVEYPLYQLGDFGGALSAPPAGSGADTGPMTNLMHSKAA